MIVRIKIVRKRKPTKWSLEEGGILPSHSLTLRRALDDDVDAKPAVISWSFSIKGQRRSSRTPQGNPGHFFESFEKESEKKRKKKSDAADVYLGWIKFAYEA